MQNMVSKEGCRVCKYIFIFAFVILLSLFVLTYVFRDNQASSSAFTKESSASDTLDIHEWNTRIDELKSTSDSDASNIEITPHAS